MKSKNFEYEVSNINEDDYKLCVYTAWKGDEIKAEFTDL